MTRKTPTYTRRRQRRFGKRIRSFTIDRLQIIIRANETDNCTSVRQYSMVTQMYTRTTALLIQLLIEILYRKHFKYTNHHYFLCLGRDIVPPPLFFNNVSNTTTKINIIIFSLILHTRYNVKIFSELLFYLELTMKRYRKKNDTCFNSRKCSLFIEIERVFEFIIDLKSIQVSQLCALLVKPSNRISTCLFKKKTIYLLCTLYRLQTFNK